jgi:hypothetical protein
MNIDARFRRMFETILLSRQARCAAGAKRRILTRLPAKESRGWKPRSLAGKDACRHGDRVGCRGLRPDTLPHHRTCGFPLIPSCFKRRRLPPASLLVRVPTAKGSFPVLSTGAARPRANFPLRLASSPPSGSFHPDSSQPLPSTLAASCPACQSCAGVKLRRWSAPASENSVQTPAPRLTFRRHGRCF